MCVYLWDQGVCIYTGTHIAAVKDVEKVGCEPPGRIQATDVLGSNWCVVCSMHLQLVCQQFPSAMPCPCQLSRTRGCVWGGAPFGVTYGHLLLSSQHCLPPIPVSTDATSLLGLCSSDEPNPSELPCSGSSTPQAPANGLAHPGPVQRTPVWYSS